MGKDVGEGLQKSIRKLFGGMHMFFIMDACIRLTKLCHRSMCNHILVIPSINMSKVKIKKDTELTHQNVAGFTDSSGLLCENQR